MPKTPGLFPAIAAESRSIRTLDWRTFAIGTVPEWVVAPEFDPRCPDPFPGNRIHR